MRVGDMAGRKSTSVEIGTMSLMCACAAAAHLAPVETLLGAYAYLGPAHYLTQMSWLHDRAYGMRRDAGAWVPPAVALAVLATLALLAGSAAVTGGALVAALVVATLHPRPAHSWGAFAAVAGLAVGMGHAAVPPALMLPLVLLPTVVHVFAFTAVFAASGVVRSPSRAGVATLVLFALCSLSFVVVPTASGAARWTAAGSGLFAPTLDALSDLLGSRRGATAVSGLVAFAYAYHYVSWFTATGFLRWHVMPPARAKGICYLWAVSTLAYLISYPLGFLVTLPLSLGHVVMEFPTDVAAVRHLLGWAWRPRRRGPAEARVPRRT